MHTLIYIRNVELLYEFITFFQEEQTN